MKYIPLTQGKVAIVDDEDYEYLNQWKWGYNGKYATRSYRSKDGRSHTIYMHRVVNNTPQGVKTDHKKGNKLDNRKTELRSCTVKQNNQNTGMFSHNTSGVKGVTWAKREKKWHARIMIDRKDISLGYFKTIDAAAYARKLGELKYFGDFRRVETD